MRDARRRAKLFITSAACLLGLAAGDRAYASCTSNVSGQHVFALSGDACIAFSPPTYTPTPTTGILPFPDNGFGLVAFGGGTIDDSSAVSVTTTGANANALFASAGGTIGALNPFSVGSILTGGLDAGAVLSASGGAVSLSGGSVTTTGDGSPGLAAILGSSVSATGTTITTLGNVDVSGIQAVGVFVAAPGAQATLTNDTIVTSGTLSHGVFATSGGVATVVGGSINVSGTDADGLLADGAGSTISTSSGMRIVSSATPSTFVIDGARVDFSATLNLTDTSVSTSGAGTGGVGAFDDGTANLLRTAVSTTGSGAAGVIANTGGAAALSGGSVATSGANAPGLLASGAGSRISTSNGTTVATTGADSPGVQADTGGVATLNGGSVTTSGIGSSGLAVDGVGSKITASNVAVTTNGGFDLSTDNFAFGLLASNGGSAAVSGGSITTNGPVAHGVFAFDGGSVTLSNGTTVLTTGNGSFGLFVNGAGASVTASGVSVTTHGAVDPTFDVPAFGAYNGSASPGAAIGGTMSLTNTAIVTTGLRAIGVVTNSGGATTIGGGSVIASGIGAKGLYVSGPGSTITATNVAVTTNGGFDSSTNSTAEGVLASNGGSATISGGAINTTGDGAYGAVANSGAIVTLTGTAIGTAGNGSGGLGINGAGSEIDATGVSIATLGGFDSVSGLHSYGVYNGPFESFTAGGVANLTDTTITTQGAAMFGVITSTGGSTSILGGSIATAGSQANGILSENGGITTVGVSEGGPTTIATTGNGAYSVAAISGGVVILTGSQISAKADGSGGLAINGAGSEIDATNAIITTLGGFDSKTGMHAYGVYNGPSGSFTTGGVANLTNTTIATSGAQMFGVITSTGGATTISGGSITTSGLGASGVVTQNGASTSLNGVAVITSGQDAHALFVTGPGSRANLSGANVLTTGGDGAIGLYAAAGGVIAATGPTTIATSGTNSISTGLSAFGVNADGAGSQVNLAAATITTTGGGAIGLYASNAAETASGGAIVVSGPLSVTTGTAPFSYGAWAQSAGSTITLSGPSAFTINGGAFALYATQGGSILSANTLNVAVNGGAGGGVEVNNAGSSATLKGATSIALNGGGDAGLFAALGGAISVQGPATITVSGAGSVGAEALSGAIAASGALNITTLQTSSPAFALSGASPSILATGGGTVAAAGDAIDFTNATNAVATFDNFKFASASGNLILADPSTATINFNSTVANAGANALLNATTGSVVTFNASASTLTGTIQTDATSTSNVNLSNGTTWNLTGPSVVSNLNVANSAILFAPPGVGGGFKTLTVSGAYVGTGASLTLNTMLGGSNSPTDQVIVNGGSVTGLTTLTIKNAGGSGARTTGAGIPVVVASNGGTTAPNAFQLASTPVVGGFEYALDRDSANQDWFLTSTPASSPSDIQNSITQLANARQVQMITSRLLSSLLLGANEQVNCSNCAGGFASIGSFALGGHTRWALSDRLTLLAGASFDNYSADGVDVTGAPIVAASLRYDLADWGRSRPFAEIGAALSPYESVTYNRTYANGGVQSSGRGSAIDREASIFGRLGWVGRFTPIDEGAVYVDLVRSWQQVGGYTELAAPNNPFPATLSSGVDTQDVARIGAQYTHLFNGRIEANVNAAFAYGFDQHFGSQATVLDFGGVSPFPLLNSGWAEFGARLGYRFSRNFVVDAFMIGTIGGEPGRTAHGGLGVRYAF